MKQLSKFLATAVAASAGLWAGHASALQICTGCSYLGADTYIGAYNSTNIGGDKSLGLNGNGIGNGTDYWVFDFFPAGSASLNVTFTPNASFSGNLQVFLFGPTLANNTSDGGANGVCTTGFVAGSTTAVQCSTNPVVGALVASGSPALPAPEGTAASGFGFTPLVSGRYVFEVRYTGGNGNGYSGNLQTNPVPEPGSLALVGLALFGLAATARKRLS